LDCYFTQLRRSVSRPINRAVLLFFFMASIAACSSDVRSPGAGNPSPGNNTNADWSIQLGQTAVAVTEGGGFVSVSLNIIRGESEIPPISLSSRGQTASDVENLTVVIGDRSLSATESSTNVAIQLGIDAHPLQTHTRTLLIVGNDGQSDEVTAQLTLTVSPTTRPDVYLIVGQSNAVGSSEVGAKRAQTGQADAPVVGIQQLNVTGNDDVNFVTASDFTDSEMLYNVGEPFSPALDPLHTGYNFQTNSKEGTKIGFGLNFARQAALEANGDVYLVPAAWSDTGFCAHVRIRLPGLGWNATPKPNAALAGTLLHDRAIERTNFVLEETGGILRGILWHQGEADTENGACAAVYAENLAELALSLRTNIVPDARGPSGRGPNSGIPFIVGTMSQGEDSTVPPLPFEPIKQQVDTAHRTVASFIPSPFAQTNPPAT